jgi:hypothetical protein
MSQPRDRSEYLSHRFDRRHSFRRTNCLIVVVMQSSASRDKRLRPRRSKPSIPPVIEWLGIGFVLIFIVWLAIMVCLHEWHTLHPMAR